MAAMASQKHGITPGQQYSLILHLVLLAIMIFGLPDFLHKKIETEPMAISVDILPVAPISNVKPVEKVEPKKDVPKPVAEKTTERKEQVEANKAQPQSKQEVVKKEEPKKIEKKLDDSPEKMTAKDFVKKPEKKKEKPAEKQDDDLKSILDSVKKTAKTEESKKPTQARQEPQQHEAKSNNYDAHMPLSLSEKDAIGQQIARCWNPNAGAKDANKLIVMLHIKVSPDGSVTDVDIADKGRYASDSFYRAAADAAVRAVKECSPLKNLPADKYGGDNGWGDMNFNFDPSQFS